MPECKVLNPYLGYKVDARLYVHVYAFPFKSEELFEYLLSVRSFKFQ